MTDKLPTHAADLRGLGRLTIDAIGSVVDIVEAMHHQIAIVPRLVAKPKRNRTTGISRLVYKSIHGAVGLVGNGLDRALAIFSPLLGERTSWPGREPALAALNGVVGDHLVASDNPLAIAMGMRREGVALTLERDFLATAIPDAGGKLLVMLHGLCMNDLQWTRKGHNHGAALARDLAYTPVYLRYNSGLHISANGRAFAEQLDMLVRAWPVPVTDLVLMGYSMGGLIARSACYYGELAGHGWRHYLDKLVFMGTPHHGAPLERGGNRVDMLLGMSPYSAPLAGVGKVRSAGITDLRHGNLIDEDWKERDRFARGGDRRVHVPLPRDVACYAIAASIGKAASDVTGQLLGDGFVPLASALGRHANPRRVLPFEASRQWVAYGASHLDLLDRSDVYQRIKRWLRPRRRPGESEKGFDSAVASRQASV